MGRKSVFKAGLSTILLFLVLETGFRLAGGAPGAGRFAERVILREHLTPRKAPGEFRIFAFGESTMHGAHYAPVSSPARWLESYLRDFLPGKKIRVVNFARMGRGASFACRTIKETLVYQPDLVIVYLGHNAFLSRSRKDDVLAESRRPNYIFREWQKKSVFLSTIYRWTVQSRLARHKDRPEEVIGPRQIESPPRGISPKDITPRNTAFFRENVEFFRENLRGISRLAREHEIPLLFFRPVSNLKDFAPSRSVHLKNLSPADLSRWEKFYGEGKRREEEGDLAKARENFLEAYKIDATFAELSFRLGRVDFKKGSLESARRFFEEARDNDAVVFRAQRDILEILEDLRREEDLPLVDTEKALLSEAPGGILGEPIIEDNVHLSLRGHALLAREAAQEIARRNWIAPRRAWHFENERPYEEMARELGIDQELLFSAYLKMIPYFASRFENRLRYTRKALAIHPEDPRALRHLAWTYWLMGKKHRAFEVYQGLGRDHPEVLNEIFSHQKEMRLAFEDDKSNNLLDDMNGGGKGGFVSRPK